MSRGRLPVDPSWPRRPHGGPWGDPAAPKFNYGPSCWSPWVQDMNWRDQIEKEDEHLYKLSQARAKGPLPAHVDTYEHIFGKPGELQKLQDRARSSKLEVSPRTFEKALVKELKSLSNGSQKVAKKYIREKERRIAAEVDVAVNAAERARIARELANTKRLIGSLAVDFNRAELDELNFGTLSPLEHQPKNPIHNIGARSTARSKPRNSARSRYTGAASVRSGATASVISGAGHSVLSRASRSSYGSRSTGALSRVSGVTGASRASRGSRASGSVVSKRPDSWRGKTLEDLLAEKREKRTRALVEAGLRASSSGGAGAGPLQG